MFRLIPDEGSNPSLSAIISSITKTLGVSAIRAFCVKRANCSPGRRGDDGVGKNGSKRTTLEVKAHPSSNVWYKYRS